MIGHESLNQNNNRGKEYPWRRWLSPLRQDPTPATRIRQEKNTPFNSPQRLDVSGADAQPPHPLVRTRPRSVRVPIAPGHREGAQQALHGDRWDYQQRHRKVTGRRGGPARAIPAWCWSRDARYDPVEGKHTSRGEDLWPSTLRGIYHSTRIGSPRFSAWPGGWSPFLGASLSRGRGGVNTLCAASCGALSSRTHPLKTLSQLLPLMLRNNLRLSAIVTRPGPGPRVQGARSTTNSSRIMRCRSLGQHRSSS